MSESDRSIKRSEVGRGAGRAWPLFVGLPLLLWERLRRSGSKDASGSEDEAYAAKRGGST